MQGMWLESFSSPFNTDILSFGTWTTRMKDLRVNLNEAKEIQKVIKQLPPLSDTVVQQMKALLRKSSTISTGLAMVVWLSDQINTYFLPSANFSNQMVAL